MILSVSITQHDACPPLEKHIGPVYDTWLSRHVRWTCITRYDEV